MPQDHSELTVKFRDSYHSWLVWCEQGDLSPQRAFVAFGHTDCPTQSSDLLDVQVSRPNWAIVASMELELA